MKKFLATLAVCAMMLGLGTCLTGCDENVIKYEKGDYECTIVQDSVQVNQILTELEKEEFLSSIEEDSIEEYVSESWSNTFFRFNKKSFEIINYEVIDSYDINSFVKTTMTIDDFKFKNNKLSSDLLEQKFEFVKLDDGSLELKYTEYYDYGTFIEEDYRPVLSLKLKLTKTTEQTVIPTAKDSLYPDKTVEHVYICTNLSLEWENELTKNTFYATYGEYGIKNDNDILKMAGVNKEGLIITTFTDGTIAYTGELSGMMEEFTSLIGMKLSIESTTLYTPTFEDNKYIIDECTSYVIDDFGKIIYTLDYESEPLMDSGYDIKIVFSKGE